MNTLSKGIMIASAVASLSASGSLVARATDKTGDEMVHCAGINECKGKGSLLVRWIEDGILARL
jgi:hypothetical protein